VIRFATLLLPLLIGACGEEPPAGREEQRDPAVARALNDPLMTDPDLSSRNEGAAAITVRTDDGLPTLTFGPDEIAAATAEAADMAGGPEKVRALGDPGATGIPLADDATPQDQLFALFGGPACRDQIKRASVWAARMPAEMAIYPRGATLAAAGSNAKGCKVRAVTFATPVPVADVLAFYANRARMIGPAPLYLRSGHDLQLRGGGAALIYDVRARLEGTRTVVRVATFER
jgi:hypothetical protein